MIYCPACNSEQCGRLGTLGNLVWFRCLSCGIDFHVKDVGDIEEEEVDDAA